VLGAKRLQHRPQRQQRAGAPRRQSIQRIIVSRQGFRFRHGLIVRLIFRIPLGQSGSTSGWMAGQGLLKLFGVSEQVQQGRMHLVHCIGSIGVCRVVVGHVPRNHGIV
jgi:hypothetical protein